jgi:hypothetical protein
MKQYLIPEGGKFYKANMHMHTNISDGKMTVEETKRVFLEKGYSIVAFTDHEALVSHNDLSDESFLAITSYEINVPERWAGAFPFSKCYHLNLYAKDRCNTVSSVFNFKNFWKEIEQGKALVSEECAKISYSRHYSVEGVNDIIRKATDDGFLVCYNHPVWSNQNLIDYSGLKGLWGVEVYNSGCNRGGYRESTQVLDDLLKENEFVCPIAADDAHGVGGCGHGWIQVKADNLEYGTVMNALERGDFYASTGPEIYDLYIEDGIVHMTCSDAYEVFLRTERRFTRGKRGTEESPVREIAFDINAYLADSAKAITVHSEPWFRIEIMDKNGKSAYTRAYSPKQLGLI